ERVAAQLVRADRVSKFGDAGSGWVLVRAAAQGRCRRVEDLGRAFGVREALAEVDAAGGEGERGHLREDRRPEAAHPRDQRLPLTPRLTHAAERSRAALPTLTSQALLFCPFHSAREVKVRTQAVDNQRCTVVGDKARPMRALPEIAARQCGVFS